MQQERYYYKHGKYIHVWESDLSDKIKREFFQTVAMSVLPYSCTIKTWIKRLEKTALSAGAVEYTDCIFAEGGKPPLKKCPGYDAKTSDGEACYILVAVVIIRRKRIYLI